LHLPAVFFIKMGQKFVRKIFCRNKLLWNRSLVFSLASAAFRSNAAADRLFSFHINGIANSPTIWGRCCKF
jgi:hypothetical protein